MVHLNYKNPHVYPYMEFQRFKHHPMVADLLKGGKRVAYGARAITEGGYQSMPKLAFPGGALLGCSAGMVNVPRIKGNHNAMLSGIAAAEAAHQAIRRTRVGDVLAGYDDAVRGGAIGKDLKTRAQRQTALVALRACRIADRGRVRYVAQQHLRVVAARHLRHGKSDAAATEEASKHKVIDYPKPDGKLSFDRLTNVAFSLHQPRRKPARASAR